jgi:hypothetical protein
MHRSLCRFLVFLMLALGYSYGVPNQSNSQPSISHRGAVSHAASVNWSRRIKTPNQPPSQIGFIAAPQLAASGGTYSNFPAVQGDLNGDGNQDVVQVVNIGTGKAPVCAISAALGNGDGTFQTAMLTTLTSLSTSCKNPFIGYPIFVGDVNGDKKDDIVILQQVSASVTVWTSNGDGTFTETAQGSIPVTTTNAVWATVTAVKPDTALDIVVADAASPNGNIWVLKNDGTGSFAAPVQIPFPGQLNPANPVNPGFPSVVVFGDFNGDGYLDFAAQAAPGSVAGSPYQMVVYLNGKGSGYGSYPTATALSTPNNVYASCFNVAGDLGGHATQADIVSANCFDNTVTVYVNKGDGTGTFSQGAYYIVGTDSIALSIADVNGDGYNDIISTNERGADITLLLNDGTGNFPKTGPAFGYATGGMPQVPALVVDKNADTIVPDAVYGLTPLKGSGNGTFHSALNYYSPGTPAGPGYQTSYGIATGDFNGDGIPDFVLGNGYCCKETAGNITVFISNGDGTFKPSVNYGSSLGLTKFQFEFVAVGDFNGDGKLDIAATDATNGGVQIFTGNGDGTFTPGPTYASEPGSVTSYSTQGIVAGDFNRDGKTDLAVVNCPNGISGCTSGATSGDVGVLINDGKGNFTLPASNYLLSAPATDIVAADLGNKQLDLLIPIYGTISTPGSSVAVLLGKGDGTFPTTPLYYSLTINNSVISNPYSLAVGDLNGDGKPDLAITIDDQVTIGNQGIAIALGNGDGTFQPNPALLSSTLQPPKSDLPHPGYVKMADVNYDGNLDLLYTNSSFSTVGLMYGKGDGTFYDPVEFASGGHAFGIAYADINGDGAPDVVTSGNADTFSGVTVLVNASGNAVALQASPNPAAFGTPITLTANVTSTVPGVTALPTGAVTFYDGSAALGSPVALNSSGGATMNKSLGTGSHSITAVYGGDVNFKTTTSAVLAQVVGAQPSYALASTPNSNSVHPGAAAQYTITLTPSDGYDGTVTFSCPASSSLPAGTTCAFSPATLTPSGQPMTTVLTITTTAPTIGSIAPAGGSPFQGSSNLWASLSGVGLLGLALTGNWNKRKRRSVAIILGILMAVMILALAGCGSGSSAHNAGTPGTPLGTSAIKATATGTAGTKNGSTTPQNLTVTLIVN